MSKTTHVWLMRWALAGLCATLGVVATRAPAQATEKQTAPAVEARELAPGQVQTIQGTLETGDPTLRTGIFVDTYQFRLRRGQPLQVTATAEGFEAGVSVEGPGGGEPQEGEGGQIDVEADRAGAWTVNVYTTQRRRGGDYVLKVASPRVERGELRRGDRTLDDGEFYDAYEVDVQPGQRIIADLTSTAFDTYVGIMSPSGKAWTNEDFEGSSERSYLEVDVTEAGQWTVMATSREEGETGRYELRILIEGGAGGAGAQQFTGTLEEGDTTLRSGEFVDAYPIDLQAGDPVTVTLESEDFDTYVILVPPKGEQVENDDFEGSSSRSQVSLDEAPVAGQYRVLVTSYEAGETGDYTLTIQAGRQQAGPGADPGPGNSQRHAGTLEDGDAELRSGEYYDTYPIELRRGQHVTVTLESNDFDTYVIAKPPQGDQFENDDFNGSESRSQVEFDAAADGTYNILVTSYEPGETGDYTLTIDVRGGGADGGGRDRGGNREEPAGGRRGTAAEASQRFTGELEDGDAELRSGEYYDTHTIQARRGQQITATLESDDFDTYVIISPPQGEQVENDDFNGSERRSQVSLEAATDGAYRILVTSYEPGETGSYTLTVQVGQGSDRGTRRESGQLEDGDSTLNSGEYADQFTFEGRPGQRVRLDVSSSAFDTYLILIAPDKEQQDNDDVEDAPGHSIIESDLTASGTYRVLVTSYRPGETGAYDLVMDLGAGASQEAPPPDREEQQAQRLQPGETRTGTLVAGDPQLTNGEYYHVYTFDAQAGQRAVVDLRSEAFDPWVAIVRPETEEEIAHNDDFEGARDRSRLEVDLRHDGRYMIVVTSFKKEETGDYTVSLELTEGQEPSVATTDGVQRIYGVFVGISAYPDSPLDYCAEDAQRACSAIEQTGMLADNCVVLQDGDATVANVRREFERLGRQVRDDDLFVFFFSGHGARLENGNVERADPDGTDEAIVLIDGIITDNEMDAMFGQVSRGVKLLILDSCFSGGFAKDVMSQPGRMGMFSSHADVPSMVANKFRAGGYLAAFLFDAFTQHGGLWSADEDGDGAISALEITQYIYERYRSEVRETGDKGVVQVQNNLGYQQFVHDREGIDPYRLLFPIGAARGDN